MELLGVTISQSSPDEILARVGSFLSEPKFHRIATVNPEFLVRANKDQVFKNSLLAADLCVADGFGIVLAGFFRGEKITHFPGADLLHEILSQAESDGYSVFLAIKKDGLSSYEEIQRALLKKFPQLVISGADIDTESSENAGLKAMSSELLLCNFGAPEQELFLASLGNNPGDIRMAMGVGGSFDYLTGKQNRAPFLLRAVGLEWFWRLVFQPKRFVRIWNAVGFFPFLVISSWHNSKKRL